MKLSGNWTLNTDYNNARECGGWCWACEKRASNNSCFAWTSKSSFINLQTAHPNSIFELISYNNNKHTRRRNILSYPSIAVKFVTIGLSENLQSEVEVARVKDALEQGREHAAALHTSLAKVISSFCESLKFIPCWRHVEQMTTLNCWNLVDYKFYFCISWLHAVHPFQPFKFPHL